MQGEPRKNKRQSRLSSKLRRKKLRSSVRWTDEGHVENCNDGGKYYTPAHIPASARLHKASALMHRMCKMGLSS
jgi:hypothetical protein